MSYRIAGRVVGIIGSVFTSEAEARAAIDQIVADGIEDELNWLIELAQATTNGGAVSIDDDVYAQRILAAAEGDRRSVARTCARERLYAGYTIVSSNED